MVFTKTIKNLKKFKFLNVLFREGLEYGPN